MDPHSADQQLFEDTLQHELVLPLAFQSSLPASLSGSEMRLRAIALVEDGRSDDGEERSEVSAALHRMEAKLDLLLGLSASLAALHRAPLHNVNALLSARGLRIDWPDQVSLPDPVAAVSLQATEWLPDPVTLPVAVIARQPLAGGQRLWLAFGELGDGLQAEMERYVFRLHRRHVANHRRAR